MNRQLLISACAVGLLTFATTTRLTAQEADQQEAEQHVRYALVDLQTFPGGTFNQATFVSDNGLAIGIASTAENVQHAVLWPHGWIVDIGTPGLGGPNSGVFGINDRGQADGIAESSAQDPNNENFCAYFTGLKCLPFLWQQGVMTALPLLGGNNGTVGQINSRGEVAGAAETGVRDPNCPSGVALNGTGPQILDYEAVIWGPKPGQIRQLSPLPGDTVSIAFWINDEGQAVGVSGTCENTIPPPLAGGPHAVVWEKDGSVHEIKSLGGTVNTSVLGVGNVAFAINNLGQAVGGSALTGNAADHAFIWSKQTGTKDLGTLDGDAISGALGINDRGEVVGLSGTDLTHSRAVIWKHGKIADLNALIPAHSPLTLLLASAINARGEIAGFGVTGTGEIHAFLAIPCDRNHAGDKCCRDRDGRASGEDETPASPKAVVSESVFNLFQRDIGHR